MDCVAETQLWPKEAELSDAEPRDTRNRFNKVEAELGTIKDELSAIKMLVGIVIALNMAIIGLIVNTIISK